MKMGGIQSRGGGFTIIETLIVLTVTTALAVSAMVLISGRQNKTSFMVAINDTQQQMQQLINETVSGYYPSTTNFNCTGAGLGGGHPIVTTTPGAGQGTNGGCTFIGKFIQFAVGAADSPQFVVYPLAGNQQDTSGNEVQDIASANPLALSNKGSGASANIANLGSVPDFTTSYNLENGLTVDHMKYTLPVSMGGGTFDTGAAGFITSFASNSCSGLCSGSQQFSLYALKNPTGVLGQSQQIIVNAIDRPAALNLVPASEVDICLTSGTTSQSGLVTIGNQATGGQLSISLQIFNSTSCT